MTLRIMLLDMLKLRRTAKGLFVPIQPPQPGMQCRIPGADIPDIALEMLLVHGVEAHDRHIQAHIRLCDIIAEVVGAGGGGQMFLRAVEGFKEASDGGFVDGLVAADAAFVDAVVDVVVGPLVCFFDLCAEGFREEIHGCVGGGEEGVEFGVHHADDLAGFIVDDLVRAGVVEDGDGVAACVVGGDGLVEIADVGVGGMDGVGPDIFAGEKGGGGGEVPA